MKHLCVLFLYLPVLLCAQKQDILGAWQFLQVEVEKEKAPSTFYPNDQVFLENKFKNTLYYFNSDNQLLVLNSLDEIITKSIWFQEKIDSISILQENGMMQISHVQTDNHRLRMEIEKGIWLVFNKKTPYKPIYESKLDLPSKTIDPEKLHGKWRANLVQEQALSPLNETGKSTGVIEDYISFYADKTLASSLFKANTKWRLSKKGNILIMEGSPSYYTYYLIESYSGKKIILKNTHSTIELSRG